MSTLLISALSFLFYSNTPRAEIFGGLFFYPLSIKKQKDRKKRSKGSYLLSY